MHRTRITAAVVAAGVLALAGCGDSTSPSNARQITLSFATGGGSPLADARVSSPAGGAAADVTVGSGETELVITKAQIALKHLELSAAEAAAASCGGDDGEAPDDCDELQVGPVLVDLPLDGGVSSTLSATVPAGTYREMHFLLHRVNAENAAERAFRDAHPEMEGASVRVEGTFGGEAFVFTSPVTAGVGADFDAPYAIEQSGQNITLGADVASWFLGAGGEVIDPRTANPGEANEGVVADNIRDSFHAFGDDDKDGAGDE